MPWIWADCLSSGDRHVLKPITFKLILFLVYHRANTRIIAVLDSDLA